MSDQTSSEKLRQKINIKKYLEELSMLTGRPVRADELCSLEQTIALRESAKQLEEQPAQRHTILFADQSSKRSEIFANNLCRSNNCPVYIWTPRTISCGALLVPSICSVEFYFDFSINEEGILVFLTSDLKDRLLIDFSISRKGGLYHEHRDPRTKLVSSGLLS